MAWECVGAMHLRSDECVGAIARCILWRCVPLKHS